MRRFLASAAILSAAFLTGPAVADEAWTSPQLESQIIWLEDIGDTSVFTYQAGDRTVRMYVEGLAANMDNRRVLTGYWMMEDTNPGDGQCAAGLTTVDGRTTHTWGHFEMRWQRRTYPSGWTAAMVTCFAGAGETIRARPLLGQ